MLAFTFDEIILLFAIGCVIGYVAETIYCIVKNGRYESRKGLVYGPFSHVYGFGAVVLTFILYPISQRSLWLLFLSSALLGGVFETVCSIFSEKVFGTVSWHYTGDSLPLFGGRTCLKYMVFWGFLGSVYIRILHPAFFQLIHMIPASTQSPMVFALTIFLIYDLIVSAAAVKRWCERGAFAAPLNRFEEWVDKNFPDERMLKIYPNMIAVHTIPSKELNNLS